MKNISFLDDFPLLIGVLPGFRGRSYEANLPVEPLGQTDSLASFITAGELNYSMRVRVL